MLDFLNFRDDLVRRESLHEFLQAARDGDVDIVRRCLNDKDLDINMTDELGMTALMYASRNGHVEIVKMLLDRGADMELMSIMDPELNSLGYAIMVGHPEIVELLVKNGARWETKDRDAFSYASTIETIKPFIDILEKESDMDRKIKGYSALMSAVIQRAETVEYLIDRGADVNTRDNEGRTCSWYLLSIEEAKSELLAASEEMGEMGETVTRSDLERCLNIDKQFRGYSYRCFDLPTERGRSIFELLLKKGLDINARDNEGNTIFMDAVLYKNKETVEYLLEHGADPTIENNAGKTAWYLARRMYKTLIEDFLKNQLSGSLPRYLELTDTAKAKIIEFGERIEEKKRNWFNAAESGDIEKLKEMLEGGDVEHPFAMDIEVWDPLRDDETAIITAAKNGRTEAVRFLLDSGANIDSADCWDNTAIVRAAENGHLETVNLLLDRRARIERYDKDDNTVLIEAARNGQTTVVELIISRIKDKYKKDFINRINAFKDTALFWAAKEGHIETVKSLLDRGADPEIVNNEGKTARDLGNREVRMVIDEFVKNKKEPGTTSNINPER